MTESVELDRPLEQIVVSTLVGIVGSAKSED